jgi:signal transduction histidine kinase
MGFGAVQKLTRLLAAPVIEPSQRATRIQAVETDIVLPLRAVLIGIVAYYFFFGALKVQSMAGDIVDLDDWLARWTNWVRDNAPILQWSFVGYVILNVVIATVLVSGRHRTLATIQWMVFAGGLLDCVLMGALTFLSNGFDSLLYWVFFVLIAHNALAIPVAFPQLLLNFFVTGSFIVGGYLDRRVIQDLNREDNPLERTIVLMGWALCCYGIQYLFEKQKQAEAEAMELAVRQERLRTAGRLAAEIAHQIKNPLSIITNSAFCLRRAVSEGETAVEEQIQIIREEVERADQIITELMGYAQLAEGKVEALNVAEELDAAVQEVFPPAAKYNVEVHKDYAEALPALSMQRRHLSGVLVNLLQNAREAMNGRGEITVAARYGENDNIQITITDNGPGIAVDKIGKIFEAYFTTREKGTGLGLAIVKHNTEMYGGSVSVDSKVGKGTSFVLEFPARILARLSK